MNSKLTIHYLFSLLGVTFGLAGGGGGGGVVFLGVFSCPLSKLSCKGLVGFCFSPIISLVFQYVIQFVRDSKGITYPLCKVLVILGNCKL